MGNRWDGPHLQDGKVGAHAAVAAAAKADKAAECPGWRACSIKDAQQSGWRQSIALGCKTSYQRGGLAECGRCSYLGDHVGLAAAGGDREGRLGLAQEHDERREQPQRLHHAALQHLHIF